MTTFNPVNPPIGGTHKDWATYYVGSCGWTLTQPINHGSKELRYKGWGEPENSLRTVGDVERVCPSQPFNIGLNLGLSRICSLDVDDMAAASIILGSLGLDVDQLITEGLSLMGNPERVRVLYRVPLGITLDHRACQWPKEGNSTDTYNVLELRAGGHLDILPPSLHPGGYTYAWKNGPWEFDEVPFVPEKLLAFWLRPDVGDAMKALCPWADKTKTPKVVRKSSGNTETDREVSQLFEVFCEKYSIASILDNHPDKYTPKGNGRWLPAGSTSGVAGVVVLKGDGRERLYCHNASDVLYTEPGTARDAFDVFTMLGFAGDTTAAFKAAAELLGFNSKGHHAEYSCEDGHLWRWHLVTVGFEQTAEGKPDKTKPIKKWVRTALTNFEARILGERLLDDGVNRTRDARVETVHNHLTRTFWLPSEQLLDVQRWAVREGGATYSLVASVHNVHQHARAAIQELAVGRYEPHDVYAHTGWREFDGEWLYLSEGGAIGPERDVTVEPEGALKGLYVIPREPHDVVEATRASLHLPYIGQDGKLAPAVAIMLAAAYRAPLCEVKSGDLTVWLEGETGTFKTTTAKLVCCHYGTKWDKAPIGWRSTVNALEKQLSAAKDALMLIDDWLPVNDEKGKNVEAVVRTQGNKQARNRMDTSRKLEKNYTPRGILIATAEDRPNRRSANARTINVALKRGEIDVSRLTEKQAQRDLLPHAMSGYLWWLRPQLETLRGTFEGRVNAIRTELGKRAKDHMRHAENLAELVAGYEMFLEYATKTGAVTTDAAVRLREQFLEALDSVVTRQSDVSHGDRPAVIFLTQLDALIASERVRLDSPENMYTRGSGDLVGYQTDEEWWLIWDAAWAEVQKALGPDRIHGRDKAVCAELVSLGVLKPAKSGKYTLVRKAQGKQSRFVVLDRAAVDNLLNGVDSDSQEAA